MLENSVYNDLRRISNGLLSSPCLAVMALQLLLSLSVRFVGKVVFRCKTCVEIKFIFYGIIYGTC